MKPLGPRLEPRPWWFKWMLLAIFAANVAVVLGTDVAAAIAVRVGPQHPDWGRRRAEECHRRPRPCSGGPNPLEAAVEVVEDLEALARSPGHVQDQVDTHGRAEDDAPVHRLVRLHRLPVVGDDHWPMPGECETEDPRVGGIDEPQANAFTTLRGEGLKYAAVDRDRVADPPVVAHVVHVAEVGADLSVGE
jgi:hypothetical protein